MLLFYIRHGDPIYEPDSLTPLGMLQAKAVAKRLGVYGIDKIYASSSNRAYQTALPTKELVRKEITTVEWFHENYAWEYFTALDSDGKLTWAESIPEIRRVFVSPQVYQLGDNWYDYSEFEKYKFKAGMKFYRDKIDEFMLSLGYRHDRETHTYSAVYNNDDRIAIFAHSGFGGVFLSSILDIPYPQYAAHHSMSHTGVTVIKFTNEREGIIPKVLQFGNDSHLYKEGIPTYHNNNIAI